MITKMLKFLKNSNFFNSNRPKINLLPRTTQTRPYLFKTTFSRVLWSMSLIHPPLSPKKFILISVFAKNFKNFQLKVNFFCYKTLQIQCQCRYLVISRYFILTSKKVNWKYSKMPLWPLLSALQCLVWLILTVSVFISWKCSIRNNFKTLISRWLSWFKQRHSS